MQREDHIIAKRPHAALREYPIVISISVEWGDQDSFAHVNNTVYLKWCETARVAYLGKIGMWQLIRSEGRGPILASLGCNYRRPVTFPDTVQIGARVAKVGKSSFRMEHAVVSMAQDMVVAEADSTLVFVQYEGMKSLPLPANVRESMSKMEDRPL